MTVVIILALAVALTVVVVAIVRDVALRDKIQKLENTIFDKDTLLGQAQFVNKKHEQEADEIYRRLEALEKLARDRMSELHRLKQIFEDQNGYV